MKKTDFFNGYLNFMVNSIGGRYLTNNSIQKLNLENIRIIGRSTNNLPIYYLKMGSGSKKILIWSQMHGNEATSTKALLDTISYLSSDGKSYLNNVTLHIIPILNPDGALLYTRENYNKKDLNRDAALLSQNESILLKKLYNDINPDFCFNLHDQKSIYSVAETKKPSILSFLSPAADKDNSETKSRIISMKIISHVNDMLKPLLDGFISRYKNDYNPNCFGDTFQTLKTPTILFESGHYKNDYNRENVRKYMCLAQISAIISVSSNSFLQYCPSDYYQIKENGKNFTDILLKNIKIKKKSGYELTNISVNIMESLNKTSSKIDFIPKIHRVGDFPKLNGHVEYNLNNSEKIYDLDINNVSDIINHIK